MSHCGETLAPYLLKTKSLDLKNMFLFFNQLKASQIATPWEGKVAPTFPISLKELDNGIIVVETSPASLNTHFGKPLP